MKTAISIPDNLFQTIDHYVKKKGISRSKLIAAAVEEYLEAREATEIANKLNQIYSEENSRLEKDLLNMQLKSIGEDKW
jgi:metal-responsive CopG/Arc/MetJ family transcriptional regulator